MKKALLSLIFALSFLSLINNVSAFSCYQETANVSTLCGGLNTGTYTPSTTLQAWNNPELTYDGDYSTYGVSSHPSFGSQIEINYSKPAGATGLTFHYKVGQFSITEDNFTINATENSACFNDFPNEVSLIFGSGLNGAFYCRSLAGDVFLGSIFYSNQLYEEAVYWEIAGAIPITDCLTITQSGTYELKNNVTGIGWYCIAVNTNDVFIEGNNYFINGDDAGGGLIMQSYNIGYLNITYKNVQTSDYGTGAEGIDIYSNITIINSVLHGLNSFMDVDDVSYMHLINTSFVNSYGVGELLILDANIKGVGDYRNLFMTQNSVILPDTQNVNATITLKNLSFTNPIVLKSGVACSPSICSNLVYAGGTATFDVTELGTYSLEESPQAPQSSVTSSTIYQVMDSSGAGLGLFLLYTARSLPILLIALVIVGIIFVIGFAVVKYIRKTISP